MSNKSVIDEAIEQMQQKKADSRGKRTGDYRIGQTITRLRRKLQLERPQFRGERWKAKQENQDKVKKDLGYGQKVDI
jgi:hypothetical protein